MVVQGAEIGRNSPLRSLYVLLGLVMCAYVVAGFASSYYFKAVTDSRELSPLVHLHGLLFSVWMVLFVAQATLISTKQYKIHRRLGIFGVGLAACMVLSGTNAALSCASSVACGAADPLFNYLIPLSDMAMFAFFVSVGAVMRKRREWHKRLMLLATVSIIDASVLRWPIVIALRDDGLRSLDGLIALWVITDLPVLAAIAADYMKNASVHAVYAWGGSALVALQVLKIIILQLW